MKKYISCLFFLLILSGLTLLGFFYLKPKIDNLRSKVSISDKIKNLVSNEADFTVAIASDSGQENNDLNDYYKKIVEMVNNSDAKFFVHLGDFTQNGTAKELADFKNFMDQNMKIPYYVVPGNHDILADESSKSVYLKYFNDLYNSWDYKDNHFVSLDNSWNLEGFSDSQLDWLEKDLKDNNDPVYIFMHRPTKIPYSDVFNINDGGTKKTFASYDRFYNIINKPENNVKEVYAGHLHMYFPFKLDNIPMTIVGSAGSAPQYEFMKSDDGSYYQYFEITVKGQGHVNGMINITN